jgi:hypothetical protein
VKNVEPIFLTSIRPPIVNMILGSPPSQAHQGTWAALLGAKPVKLVNGTATSSAMRLVP